MLLQLTCVSMSLPVYYLVSPLCRLFVLACPAWSLCFRNELRVFYDEIRPLAYLQTFCPSESRPCLTKPHFG